MKNHEIDTNALIIGGGIIGLSLAWELANRGIRSSVIDRARLGRGASWAGAGILPAAAEHGAVDPLEQLRSLSHRLHAQWAERLRSETQIDTGFTRCGGIHLARTPAEAATLLANRGWWEEHGIAFEQLTMQSLGELEPTLASLSTTRFKSAWRLPNECQLRNPHHLRALAKACQQRGVQFLEDTSIETFQDIGPRRLAAVTQAGQVIEAEQICVCSGAHSRMLLEQLGHSSGIMPVRGQMVLYRWHSQQITHVINEGHRYLVPRADGHVLAGSVEEEVGFDPQTTPEAIAQIRAWAEDLCPALQSASVVQTWAGLRPGSFDSLPYIGRIPNFDNMYLAAGHFRHGLHLSCGTAVVMADLIQNKTPGIDLTPFRIGRG